MRDIGSALGLEVDLDRRLPPVCLKCGSTTEIVRRPERLAVVTPAARSMGMVGGVIGAVTASMLRNAKELIVPILVVVVAAIIGLVVYSSKTARRVDVALPLCTQCDEAWSKAKAARPFFLGVFLLTALLVIAGIASEAKPLLLVGGILFFGVCIYAVITKPAARYVIATSAEGSRLTLAQVSPTAIERIRTGDYPKRKKKKQVTDERASASTGSDS